MGIYHVSKATLTWTSVTIGLFISALDPGTGQFSVIFAIVVVLPQLLLSGGLGPDFFNNMKTWTQYISNVFPARWGLEAMLTAFYSGSFENVTHWIPDFTKQVIGYNFGSSTYYYTAPVLTLQSLCWLLLCGWRIKQRDTF